MRRPTFLGAKLEECRRCGVLGPHLILRTTHWFTVFRFPVFLLWMKHSIVCPNCGDDQRLSFLTVRHAFKSGRLRLDRPRPGFDAASLQRSRAEDLAAVEMTMGPSSAALIARWTELANSSDQDTVAGTSRLVQQAVPNQLTTAPGPSGNVPSASEVFDPVVQNPKRGFFDGYLKLWALAAVAIVVISVAVPRTKSIPPAPSGVSGTAHLCWATGGTLEGCQDDTTSAMLFGDRTGTEAVCYFIEPLLEGQSASCTTP